MAVRGPGRDNPVGVTVVETPVSLSYARKARVAFIAVAAAFGTVTVAAMSTMAHPVTAVVVGVLAGAVCGLVVALAVRAWPALRVLWHWSTEVALFAAVVAAWAAAASATHPVLPAGLALVGASVFALVGPLRRRLVAWAWCGVVRHRLRLCFAEFIRSAARAPGCLPLVLVARPTPAGERVWVWLRPGLDLSDLDGKTGKLAVACWAGEVRVVRASASHAALIRVDIARRDPLTGMVRSPLAHTVPAFADPTPVSLAGPSLALDLCDLPEEVPEPRAARR
jgi:hypothetical protein